MFGDIKENLIPTMDPFQAIKNRSWKRYQGLAQIEA
jgi:hypothetical protein